MSEAVYSQLRDAIIDFDADKAKEIAHEGGCERPRSR